MGSDDRAFGLPDLAALFGGEDDLRRALGGLHEIRRDGIYACHLTEDELKLIDRPPFEIEGAPEGWKEAELRLTHGSLSFPVLNPTFSAEDLLRFLDLRRDLKHTIVLRFTNDPTEVNKVPPLDEDHLRRLAINCRTMADLLRDLLSPGGRWCGIEATTTESTTAAPQARATQAGAADRKAGPNPGVKRPPVLGKVLTTTQVCEAFEGVVWNRFDWRRLIDHDRPKWLLECLAAEGKQGEGGYAATWHPMKIAAALSGAGKQKRPRKWGTANAMLDRAFQKRWLLPFQEEWRELKRDYPAIDPD